ncbi:MAG: hypothetical protein GX971_03310, partial [Firmicutes bacterium]|nr:hypothetical protein [Bacillota bacterium]
RIEFVRTQPQTVTNDEGKTLHTLTMTQSSLVKARQEIAVNPSGPQFFAHP